MRPVIKTKKKDNPLLPIGQVNEIKAILEGITPSLVQKKRADFSSFSNPYPLDWRISELKNPISKELKKALEEELFLKVYTQLKKENLDINYFDSVIEKVTQIKSDIINNCAVQENTFSPLLYCLHADLVSAVATKANIKKEVAYDNLWSDITQYSISNVNEAKSNSVELPQALKYSCSHVKQFIWVLTKDKEVAFGHERTSTANDKAVLHVHLAKARGVISAGIILFSEDMKKVVAINPGSGHYRPNVESCLQMKQILDKSQFDTSQMQICDLNWTPDCTISQKILSNISRMRQQSLPKSLEKTAQLNI